MIENAIRVASEASAADLPTVIAEWSRRHPGLTGRSAPAMVEPEESANEPTAIPVEPAP